MSCTMKDHLCVLMAIVFLMTTNGNCPSNVRNISITTCSRSVGSGPRIYVDFNKINQPCVCTVAFTGFAGDLLVTAETLQIPSCNTEVVVNGSYRFGCPIPQGSSARFRLSVDQSIDVQAEYSPPSSPGTFYQCLRFQENGGNGGVVGITCDVPSGATTRISYTASTTRKTSSPSTSTTTKTTSPSITTKIKGPLTSPKITSPSPSTTVTTTVKRSTQPLSSYTVQSTESTSRFSNNINTENSTSFVTTIAVPYSSSIESTQDDPKEMISNVKVVLQSYQPRYHFIAGSAAGGVVLLTGLMIFIMLKINRARKRSTKDENKKEDGAHTNEVFDYNNELTENPLYITSESAVETENTPGEQHELGLPNNKPIDPMPVYAAPNKNRNHHQMTNSGDVYAQVYK